MYAKALIKGLQRFISEVEKLQDSTEFYMNSYYSCVIGKTLGWPGFYMSQREREALRVYTLTFVAKCQRNTLHLTKKTGLNLNTGK
ncbi:hypothetical protein Ac42p048 [Acinetobacter phage Ac42]|uniref:hypothetical protein n=1 Tax=Acinetobacter phage Ac42 TaxID=762660 RepID=UPI0001EBCC92|nr:hypothetical protein Ac42p048 [Acinetobacter phage Ac42]ADI96286.1 hypothetical protein Ac42p048 [Acinetobacter phage Ac42]